MRTEEIKIRLTASEKATIQDIARKHRTTSADLIRYQVLGKNRVRKLPDRDLLAQIFRQASGIGTNINQISKNLNESVNKNEHNLTEETVVKLQSDLSQYQKSHAEIIELLKSSLGK